MKDYRFDKELNSRIIKLYSNMTYSELARYFALEEVRKQYKVIDGILTKINKDDIKHTK